MRRLPGVVAALVLALWACAAALPCAAQPALNQVGAWKLGDIPIYGNASSTTGQGILPKIVTGGSPLALLGGTFLPLAGGAVTGATTFGATLGVAGTATLASGSANHFVISGSSGSPLIAVTGSGNAFATIRGLGTLGVLLEGNNGPGPGAILETLIPSSGSIGNFLTITAEPLGTPVLIGSSDSTQHQGIEFQVPTQVAHNFAYSGVAGIANANFLAQSTITGTSAVTGNGAYAINQFALNGSLTTSASINTLIALSNYQAGFYGPANTFSAIETTAGLPALPSAWAPTTAYAPVGQLVLSSINEYALVTVGTSGAGATFTGTAAGTTAMAVTGLTGTLIANMAISGAGVPNGLYITAPCTVSCILNKAATFTSAAITAGGPGGTGQTIPDGGGAVWREVVSYSQAWYHTTLASQNGITHSLGGTSTNPLGFAFGFGTGTYLTCTTYPTDCATNINEAVGAEIDAFMALGTSAASRTVLQLVGGGTGGQGWIVDTGLAIASSPGVPGSSLVDPIVLSNNSPNGVAFSLWSRTTGTPQHMAGVLDMLRVIADGDTVTQYTAGGSVGLGGGGGGYLLRWANGMLTNPTGPFAGGVLELGAAAISPTSAGLTLDVTSYLICGGVLTSPTCSPAVVSGGTGWTTNGYATDDYGDLGYVTASAAGAVIALTVAAAQPQSAAHNGTITWYPDNVSGFQTPGGSNLPPSSFTATEAWLQISSPTLTLGGAAQVKFGTANFTANGSTATVLTSLGPAGAHTTVQEWLTVQDAGGTVGYIPVY